MPIRKHTPRNDLDYLDSWGPALVCLVLFALSPVVFAAGSQKEIDFARWWPFARVYLEVSGGIGVLGAAIDFGRAVAGAPSLFLCEEATCLSVIGVAANVALGWPGWLAMLVAAALNRGRPVARAQAAIQSRRTRAANRAANREARRDLLPADRGERR